MEISVVKTMVNKAFDNDMVPGHAPKAFRKVKRKLRKGGNARKRILGFEEYLRLCRKSPFHLKALIKVAFNTGMRGGELRGLKWSHVDRDKMFIRLPAELTKEKKSKNIPINWHVKEVPDNVPHALRHEYVFTYKGQPVFSNVAPRNPSEQPAGRRESPMAEKSPTVSPFMTSGAPSRRICSQRGSTRPTGI
jgi:integrase